MLHELYSDLSSFKTVKFHEGLNLLLAEKTEQSTQGHTRNGAGKSSLVELINSLLGGRVEKSRGSILKQDELEKVFFGLSLNVDDKKIRIERQGASQRRIWIRESETNNYPIVDSDEGKYLDLKDWRNILGRSMFALSDEIVTLKHTPTFRSLFAYFARTAGGFDLPDKTTTQQHAWSKQVNVSYLLKLGWKVAREFEYLRQKDGLIKALSKASKEGSLGEIMGAASDLRTDIHLKQTRIDRVKTAISEFRVLPEYEEKEDRATEITRQLATISAEDTADKEWLVQLERSLEEEIEPSEQRLDRLFVEAETTLPEVVRRRFDEVKEFHDSVVKNRRQHLKQELDSVENRIAKRHELKERMDIERAELLSILQSHGALDQYMKLQTSLAKDESALELLKRKLEATEDLDDKKSDLKIQRQTTLRKMRIDHVEREFSLKNAVVSFAEISGELYEEPGRFKIDQTDDGPRFEFDIPGKKSTGKSKMQIFCFDMMLMKLWSKEPQRPEVLIHDSVIFDGVDERQIAKALVIGSKMAKAYDFQYIVTMNSDDLPDMSDYPDFDLSEYRVNLDINDKPDGGLFGMRF
ncbi:MAG: DUF2326 domain-containing protein [Candidatus Thiodiazotropha lotti]|nr:DUF2326 domain-containing protein [Candidatus Thiodiazotropha lotti]MCW4182246.1 DUF2326 domain-containing protein [Candidatus Thiodiazotropha weberae]